jgi:sec-independent protein translocase protein TatB
MLPGLGFNEIIILGVLALVVVGPKDLPLLLRKLGRWTAKLRGMAQEFRTGFDELARQAELDELRREVDALRRTTNLSNIAHDLTKPLPTLEDYAGLSKPAPPPKPLPAPGPAIAPQTVEPQPMQGEPSLPARGPSGARVPVPTRVAEDDPPAPDAPMLRSAP